MKGKKIAEILISISCVIIIAAIIVVIAAGAGYTVLSGDDFTHGVRVGVFHVSLPKYFIASLLYVKDLYMDWQGTFFAMFLQAFLSPINNFGLPQLRAVMVGNAFFFFAALLALLWVGLSFFRTDEEHFPEETASANKRLVSQRLLILTAFFVTIMNTEVYSEIWFWFSGAVAYSMPFSVLLVALTLILLLNRQKAGPRRKTGCAVCAGLLLFLSSGGSLAVAGAGCYTALLLTAVFFLISRKQNSSAHSSLPQANPAMERSSLRCNLAVFAAGVAGALINVAAPGNFSRHDETAGVGLHFGRAIGCAVRMFVEETGRLFRETMLGLVFLFLIAMGLYLAGKCRIALKEYGIVTVFALAAGPVAYFPVALGYGSYYIPNRCYFVIDAALVISLLNLALFVGVSFQRVLKLPADGRSMAFLLYVCLAAVVVSPLSVTEMPLYRIARSVHNGSYHDYYEKCVEIYGYLETCPEREVVLEMPEYIEDFECFYLDEDKDGWVNRGIAAYYGKESVRRAE